MFQTGFPSKLHIQRQVFVRPIVLPATRLTRVAAGSSIGLTNAWRCMCSFELLMMDGKNRLKHVQRLTEINKLRKVASCWLYSENRLHLLTRAVSCYWWKDYTWATLIKFNSIHAAERDTAHFANSVRTACYICIGTFAFCWPPAVWNVSVGDVGSNGVLIS